jgi:hypothetical protein
VDDHLRIASMQLSRMRGMTAMYHRRFFFDVNFTTILVLVLFVVGWWGVEQAFLLVPVVALIGAVQTSFDSAYLVFARWYAAYLERHLNDRLGERVHVGAELEAAYLFELGTRKVVTIPVAGGFTWFSYVTIFYTVIGAFAYLFGLLLGWDTLMSSALPLTIVYCVGLFGLTITSLLVGIWWFVGGVGERRLQRVLDGRFGASLATSDAEE